MDKCKLGKACEMLYGFGENIVWVVALVIIGVLAGFNFVFNASVLYSTKELVTIGTSSPLYILLAVCLGGVFAFVAAKIKCIDERKLFRFFCVIYLVAGAYWILNISTTLRADAAHVNNAALMAARGDFSFLELGQDIRNHPWQLGMITYERILGLFSKNVQLLFLVNLLEILGINYLTYRMTDMVFEHNHQTNKIAIMFSFAFLPQFFFLTFAYGLIPGFFCMMCAFYFQQKYFREARKRDAVCAILMGVLAVVLKGNNMVGIVVMLLLFFMEMLKSKKLHHIVLAAALFALASVATPTLITAYEMESGYDLNGGEPKLLYVAMGIRPDNRGMAPGWYSGYNDYAFGQANFDPDVANEMAKESIKESIAHYIADPADAVEFFSGKIASVWCEPMYQSVWSGPLSDANQVVSTRILESIYHDATLENLVSVYMKGYIILLLVLAFVYVLRHRKKSYAAAYALVYLIGGFLLHIVWEGKSQYVYMYIFILIPCCAGALSGLSEIVGNKVRLRLAGREIRERDKN